MFNHIDSSINFPKLSDNLNLIALVFKFWLLFVDVFVIIKTIIKYNKNSSSHHTNILPEPRTQDHRNISQTG